MRTWTSYESTNDTTRYQKMEHIFNYFEEHDTCQIKIFKITYKEVRLMSYLINRCILYCKEGGIT